jgi:hypothetical protein
MAREIENELHKIAVAEIDEAAFSALHKIAVAVNADPGYTAQSITEVGDRIIREIEALRAQIPPTGPTDRAVMNPILGDPFLLALALSDVDTWAKVTDLIAMAFRAGKGRANGG